MGQHSVKSAMGRTPPPPIFNFTPGLYKAVGERTLLTKQDMGNTRQITTHDTGKITAHRQKYRAWVTTQDRDNNLAQCYKFRTQATTQDTQRSRAQARAENRIINF